jgi:hypothetical protein
VKNVSKKVFPEPVMRSIITGTSKIETIGKVTKVNNFFGKGQNLKKITNRLILPSASKLVSYHGVLFLVLPMAKWLKRSALTHRTQVRSRAQNSSFNFVVKIHENFCIFTFLCGEYDENFWKNRKISKKRFFYFSKSFHRKIIAPSCSPHKNVDMQNFL